MSQPRVKAPVVQPIFGSMLKGWLEWVRHRLYAYRLPFRGWHSWVVHDLIISIAAMHNIPEVPVHRLDR